MANQELTEEQRQEIARLNKRMSELHDRVKQDLEEALLESQNQSKPYKVINSPLKPGPEYVKLTPELEECLNYYYEGYTERLTKMNDLLSDCEEEINRRRSLGEDL